MTVYRTQCPHCQHEFSISDAQLALKDGYARCSQCLQIFLASDNLTPTTRATPTAFLANPPTQPIASPSSATPVTPTATIIDKRDEPYIIPTRPTTPIATAEATIRTPQPSLNAVITPTKAESELFFDDQIGLDDLPDNATSAVAHPPDFNFDILEDFEKLAVPKTSANSLDKTGLISTSAGIPNHQNTDTTNDEAWLEELLNQEKQKELNASYFDKQKNPVTPQASDVASLLDDFGVDIAPQKQLSQEAYQEKVNQRLAHSPTPQVVVEKTARSGVLTGLWVFGSILLLVGMAVQYVVYNTDAIAKSPAQASTVRGLCDTLHLPCNIPYADLTAVDAKLMSIEAKADKSDVMIMLTNQSNLTQLYPTLKLTLQANNSPVAQVIATPAQYLDDRAKSLNPQQLKPIKLRLDLSRNKFDKVSIEKLY